MGELEEAHDDGEDLLAGQARSCQVALDGFADARQPTSQLEDALVLTCIAPPPPFGVVAVLLATARIAAHSLEVPSRVGADPDVRPRRRDGQGPDTREDGPVADATAVLAQVVRSSPSARAPVAGRRITDVVQWRGHPALALGPDHDGPGHLGRMNVASEEVLAGLGRGRELAGAHLVPRAEALARDDRPLGILVLVHQHGRSVTSGRLRSFVSGPWKSDRRVAAHFVRRP